MCSCPLGYSGTDCSIVYDFCRESPCSRGLCTNLPGVGYKCTCEQGYTG